MLSPETIKKIKKIHIHSRRQVDTMMAGQYRSVFRGTGVEFEEVREYTPGDEVKNIDWKVSARMGEPYVKLFREEREMVVMLLVDMSASGRFGTSGRSKREAAAEIASILAFNAVRNNDKVGVILFTDRVEKYIPPKKGTAHIWRVIKEIYTFRPQNRTTDISQALRYLGHVSRKRTVSFLISDFLDNKTVLPSETFVSKRSAVNSGFEKSLKIASKRHELISIILSDPKDFELPKKGIVFLKDFETGENFAVDASDRRSRKQYEEAKHKEYLNAVEMIKKAGVDCMELDTESDAGDVLVRYFRYRERMAAR